MLVNHTTARSSVLNLRELFNNNGGIALKSGKDSYGSGWIESSGVINKLNFQLSKLQLKLMTKVPPE